MTRVGYYADLHGVSITLNDAGKPVSWVHALPGGTYNHPVYGEMDFNDDRIRNFADSVTSKIRLTDPDIDYDHKQDPAKGNKAAGWVKDALVRTKNPSLKEAAGAYNTDLWVLVEWTPQGAQSVRDGEYRYFSSELADEWTDNTGKTHKDVFFGGGITNRPYMKQLLPLNLSDLTFGDPAPTEGEQVDPKELRRKLGLSEDAPEKDVDAKLALVATLGDPKPADPNDELKKLAEANPLVRAFMDQMSAQQTQLAEMQKTLAQTTAANRLSALITGAKVSLTPVVLNEAKDLLAELPSGQADKVFGMLKAIVEGDGTIELGERGTTDPTKQGGVTKTKKQELNEAVAALQTNDKLSYTDALERVSRTQPQLYREYQQELMGGGAQ
jgi:hypothetical protein